MRALGVAWQDVVLRRTRAAADPDASPRPVLLPAAWEEDAAAALAALVPGTGVANLPRAAEAWIARAAAGLRRAGGTEAAAGTLATALRELLLRRRGAPGAAAWRGAPETRFVLNLPAFLESEGGFDAAGYAAACAVAVRALEGLGKGAPALAVGFADLAGLLAELGVAYDSEAGRAVGAALAALTRGAAAAESGRLAELLGARTPLALDWPAPPPETAVPGLAAAARAALDAAAGAPGLRHTALVALARADAVEALLGAETAGLAPAPGATRTVATPGGVAEVPTRAARRAAAAFGADRAAAVLAPVPAASRVAMCDAVAPFLHAAPPEAVAVAAAPRPAARPSPAPGRQPGHVLHVTVGGHRVALRTAEDASGRLTEIAFTLSKEGAAFRSLLDGFAQSVTLGLRRGVPLSDYVELYAYTRFGPAGAVEGDPAIPRATSILDWAFRRLALDYLGRHDMAQPSEADCAPDALGTPRQVMPLLPLDLPEAPPASPRGRRRALRVVNG